MLPETLIIISKSHLSIKKPIICHDKPWHNTLINHSAKVIFKATTNLTKFCFIQLAIIFTVQRMWSCLNCIKINHFEWIYLNSESKLLAKRNRFGVYAATFNFTILYNFPFIFANKLFSYFVRSIYPSK